MEGSPWITESRVGRWPEKGNTSRDWTPTDDQFFLLYFIMGTYFAPDLKGEISHKSFWQRHAEGLPPYSSDQLAGSFIKTVEVERVYYYVLRNAHESVIVKLPWLHQFFRGNLSTHGLGTSESYLQFSDLFPPHLHPHSLSEGQYEVISNIVFINTPETFYISSEYIRRFKRLTNLDDLVLDSDEVRVHQVVVDGEALYNVDVEEVDTSRESTPCPPRIKRPLNSAPRFEASPELTKRAKPTSSIPSSGILCYSRAPRGEGLLSCKIAYESTPLTFDHANYFNTEGSSTENLGVQMIFLPSRPTGEELRRIVSAASNGYALTGTAAMGQIGPVLGLIDIGECEDSYLFRVSLPGVKRDEREFSCEVENDGKVFIRGVTVSGEKTICRHQQVFEMQSQNLTPPGHFSISFRLPGPVNPHKFSGNFGSDGILEGIVMKDGEKG